MILCLRRGPLPRRLVRHSFSDGGSQAKAGLPTIALAKEGLPSIALAKEGLPSIALAKEGHHSGTATALVHLPALQKKLTAVTFVHSQVPCACVLAGAPMEIVPPAVFPTNTTAVW